MNAKRTVGKPPTIPDELSQFIQLRVHPQLYKEMKMSAIREDYGSIAEWVHERLCKELGRRDLSVKRTKPSRATATAS